MKTIGLIGGMSWESSAVYYKIVNEFIKEKFGGLNSAKCVLFSVNFREVEECQKSGDWDKSADILIDAGNKLAAAGADFVLICTNTMHKVADKVAKNISVPLIHIADVTADAVLKAGFKKVALLGTKYTMEHGFYKDHLLHKGIETLVPEEKERTRINDIIFKELCVGNVLPASKEEFLKIMDSLMKQGAGCIILGCTEIGLLINSHDTKAPLFDTTIIHARAAAELALK